MPLISWDNRQRIQHYGSSQVRHKVRHKVSRRIEAFFCLLTIIAQLAFAIAHSWEMPIEAAALSITRAFHAFPKGAGDTTTLAKAATAPRRGLHDPSLCLICQVFPQTRHGLRSTGLSISPPHCSLTCVPGCTLRQAGSDLTVAAPRAPPSLT
jgi:hypothetical protein